MQVQKVTQNVGTKRDVECRYEEKRQRINSTKKETYIEWLEERERTDEEKRWSEWFKERERERVNGVKTETQREWFKEREKPNKKQIWLCVDISKEPYL